MRSKSSSIFAPSDGVTMPLLAVGIAADINWWWLVLLLLLLLLTAIASWRFFKHSPKSSRTNGVRPNVRGGPPPPISIKPTKRPAGQNIISDWKTERATDELGQPVKVRSSGLVNQKLTIRIDDERSELARASISLQSMTQLESITDDESESHRIRIQDFEVKRLGQRRGMEALLLNKIEELATEHEASEVYSQSPEKTLRRALSKREYERREEEQEMFKTLDEASQE